MTEKVTALDLYKIAELVEIMPIEHNPFAGIPESRLREALEVISKPIHCPKQ